MKKYKITILKYIGTVILIFCLSMILITKSESQLIKGLFDSKSDAPHNYTCATCHILHNNPNVQLTTFSGNALLCMSCHVSGGLATALPFDNADIADPQSGTGTSHAWNKPAVNATYETNIPTNSEMADRIYENNIVCSTCHDQHLQTYPPFLRISNAADALCKDCHSARDVGIYDDDNTNHRGSHPVGLIYNSADPRFSTNPVPPLQLISSNIECSSCHKLHYATINDGNILRVANNNNLCTGCHTYGTHNGFSCLDCHQVHNPNKENIFLIKDIVNGSNVNFYAETGVNAFGDQLGTEDGICEVCHTSTAYYKADGSGESHNPGGSNCTSCHPHSSGFQPAGCSECHIQNFPDWGTADSHFAHTSKYDFNCNTCHFNYGFGGSSEPSHPSLGPANVNFNPTGLATRNGNDANIPAWNSPSAGQCANIYCHSNGRTAYRGTDGTYTWSGTIGPQTATYANTPIWNSSVGTINACTFCHSGVGNMNSPYTINSPFVNASPPNTGAHLRGVHVDNDQDFSSLNWFSVQCFWCHNTNGVSTSPNLQGTYGTSFHVDGITHFDPRQYVNGGTYANGMSYSAEGNHCATGRSCW